MVVQDFNLDGKLDLIFGNGQLALGNGDGTFTLSSPLFPAPSVERNHGRRSLSPRADDPSRQSGSLSCLFFAGGHATPSVGLHAATQRFRNALRYSLGAGAHTITAQYSGDANYATDTSTGVAVTVSQATSATAVTSSANPSFAGQSVTLTASVTGTGPTPTGNVIFTSGSTTLGTVALNGGISSLYDHLVDLTRHADNYCDLLWRCQYAGFVGNDQSSDRRCVHANTWQRRWCDVDRQVRAGGYHPNQCDWRCGLLWSGCSGMFRSACRRRLQLHTRNCGCIRYHPSEQAPLL